MTNNLDIEVTADPLGRGYAGMTDQQLLDSLNALDRTRNVTDLSAEIVYDAIDHTEWNALTDAQRTRIMELLHMPDGVNLWGRALDEFKSIFGTGSATAASLNALRTVPISRSEECGWSAVVRMKDLRMHTISRQLPA